MIEAGLNYTSTLKVSVQDTATSMGSGDMDVLATPMMIALMENAAMKAVSPALPAGFTTVGSLMNTTHVKPSKVGDEVKAIAELIEVDNRKLTFSVTALDADDITIGEGVHVRYVVDREKFLAKL